MNEKAVIYCDNLSSIQLAKNPIFHAWTKHIDVHYHFVQEQIVAGSINLVYISIEDQVADISTKVLGAEKLCYFCTMLGFIQLASSSRGSVEMSSPPQVGTHGRPW